MKLNRKVIAILVIAVLLISCCTVLFNNKSMAAQTNVTVVFTADADSNLSLGADNQTLTYTCSNGNSYPFTLKQGNTTISFTKYTDEVDGHFSDRYVAEGISSNEDVRITVPEMNFNDVQIIFGEVSIGMWEVDGENYWASQPLIMMADENSYQFRIEENRNQQGGGSGERPATQCNIDFGTASWTIGDEVVTASMDGKILTNGPIDINSDERINLTGYNPVTMEPVLIVIEDGYEARLNVDSNQTWVDNTTFSVPYQLPMRFVMRERTAPEERPDNRPEPNATAIVNLSSDEEWADSYKHAMIDINGYPINDQIDYGQDMPAVNEAHYFYDEARDHGKVTIFFSTLFIEKFVGTIVVNNEVFDVTQDLLDYSDRTSWLYCYDHQTVGIHVEVDKADVYDIKINTTETEPENQWIGNFLWSSDDSESGTDAYIGHSTLELLSVTYEVNGEQFYVEGADLLNDRFVEYDPYRAINSLAVPEGAMCTMRITPEFGYQVVSFGTNGNYIETGEEVSVFSFPISKGNFHLGAQVVPVDNVVNAKSSKVKSGTIEIGDNEFDSGSLVLTVNDVELNEEKIAKFQEQAGDYTIKGYLDIDLDKVLYKGTEEDVWSERIHELDGEVTITLQLEEGIDGNSIVIVHNIDDGDEFEIIQIDSYDPETNTITFRTKSFSNYAIASKTDSTEEDVPTAVSTDATPTATATTGSAQKSPKTGDNIIIVVAIFVVSVLGIIISIKSIKNKNLSKH